MIFLLALLALTYAATPVKHLAGPASEFESRRVPNPATVQTTLKSASRNLWFSVADESDLLLSHKFPVEGAFKFVLSFASPVSGLRLELMGPDGSAVKARVVEKAMQPINDDAKDDIPNTVFIVEDDLVAGTYTFNVFSTSEVVALELDQALSSPRPDAVLTVLVDDTLVIKSHLQSYLLKAGQEIGLVATIESTAEINDLSVMGIEKAIMEVTLPDGTTLDISMHDDGIQGNDLVAADRQFSATFKASVPGVYMLESILDGQKNALDADTADSFERTAQHVIHVSAATIELAGKSLLRNVDSERLEILLAVTGGDQQPSLRGYTEVWGTTPAGELKAVCWIGGLVTPANGFVGLELNMKWLQLAGVSSTGPFVLRNTYLADVTTSFPVAVFSEDIHVVKSASLVSWSLDENVTEITQEMLWGKNPLPAYKASEVDAAVPDLLLIPGYCADVNPWTSASNYFTNAFYPVDKGNYGNHQYAEKIMAQADAKSMTAYGVIGHSQGGMVALHMHNYFWSGIETASTSGGKVLLQSLGTPFRGNTAAGSAANLGEVFGVGCGSNTDLSLDGAANWNAGIGSAARADLHFYTTTYEQGNFFGDWCSLPMNLILQWPNDGVTEYSYAGLTGGVNEGNTEKWCHSTEMTYNPQYTDAARNKVLNANAARAPK